MVGGGCLMVMGRREANIGHVGGAVNSTIKKWSNNWVVYAPWHHPWVTPPKTAALIHASSGFLCIGAGDLRGNHHSLVN